ncbi:MAG: MFS transporter [Opitutaceae bacterium]|jgi:OPA family glycerol-3-phosphate transporter-like MFS transporter
MPLLLVGLCLVVVVGLYFYNNPLKHGTWFLVRRFINWFPLGMTYAFLYMGRYNLNVSKNALGSAMTKEDLGVIFAAGTVTYAFSFLVNGPLVDKIGGKKGIIIAALGASFANILMGVLTYFMVSGRLTTHVVLWFSVLYALNMYFQSYGAVSIIKVKAYWFHVRERGVFGAIFGTLISFGVYFAFDWGQSVVELTKAVTPGNSGWFHRLMRTAFAADGLPADATWAVFYVPAFILLFWALMDWWLIKDTPEEAGFPPFDPADASSGQKDEKLSAIGLLKKVFCSRLLLLVALVDFTSGVMRNGVYQWYFVFAHEVAQPGAEFFLENWGLLLCLFGIVGGFAGGLISDKCFQSRRGPPAVILCGFMFLMTILMAVYLHRSPFILGAAAVMISMAVIGVHCLMSATAATDFGGRHATATCSGIVDGCVYLGTGLQSFSLGFLIPRGGWICWPLFLMPFTIIGVVVAAMIWRELPAATRKYIDEVEGKKSRKRST